VLHILEVYSGSQILILIHPVSNNSNKGGGEEKIGGLAFFVATHTCEQVQSPLTKEL
jgi:hypothetical protein